MHGFKIKSRKSDFFLAGNRYFMVGIQYHITVCFQELLNLVEVDNIGVVNAKKRKTWARYCSIP